MLSTILGVWFYATHADHVSWDTTNATQVVVMVYGAQVGASQINLVRDVSGAVGEYNAYFSHPITEDYAVLTKWENFGDGKTHVIDTSYSNVVAATVNADNA